MILCLDLAVEYWIERPLAHTFNSQLTQGYQMQELNGIEKHLSYDPHTGHFTHLKTWGSVKAGDVAGFKNIDGFILLAHKNKHCLAHRVAWWFQYGYTPKPYSIEHLNGDRSDNRIANLQQRKQVVFEDIRDYLSYDPLTGQFTWIKRQRQGVAGHINGHLCKRSGYIVVGFAGKTYRAHRLAWYFTYGYMPDVQVDHKNEIRNDNRLCNLRLATSLQNGHNSSKPSKNNTSGYLGVSWCKNRKKWKAAINFNYKREVIGYYDTAEEASEAYLARKRELHLFWIEK